LLITVFCLSGCSDSTDPDDPVFKLRLTVADRSGNPINGLQVSAWSLLPAEITQDGKSAAGPTRAATNFRFALAENSQVSLSLYDVDDQKICTLVDGFLPMGMHTVIWNGMTCDLAEPEHAVSGVYRAEFEVRDPDTSEITHEDEVLAVMYLADPEQQILGRTDREGRFGSEDKSFFPHLYDWPPLAQVNEVAETLGTFSYTGGVRIVLTDTGTMQTQTQDFVIDEDLNRLRIVWDPAKMAGLEEGAPELSLSEFTRVNSAPLPVKQTETQIFQNYPNPFN
jgi:hypothetical protein